MRAFVRGLAAPLLLALAACTTPPAERGEQLLRGGQPEAALRAAEEALRTSPDDAAARALAARARQQATQRAWTQAERARAAGRWDEAAAALQRVLVLEPAHPRAATLARELARERRHAEALDAAETALRAGRHDAARGFIDPVLTDSPQHPRALALRQRLAPAVPPDLLPPTLAEAYRQPVTLEFREAPLRSVFEALARGRGLNIVFDKEVRGDQRVTLFLREVPLDEALRLVLQTQQLERKVLNGNTLLIYPDTAAKQRQHQELVTRTLYLTNAEPKSAAALVRAIAKTQDLHVDERLNALVVRDAPAIVRLVEDLVAAIDLPEPEVMLEVEVLEVASSQLDELGLQWPETIDIGLVSPDGTGAAPDRIVLSRDLKLRASIANPGLVATLRGGDGSTHTLANPTIRARNREKAQVHVGEKLPVFASTAATANVPGTTTVSYLDVGIKLDVEPTVQLDNEVTIRIGLEVSNLVRQVPGPAGSVGYEIGTRRTSTSLRLRDGETQILAGLVNDQDRRSAGGLPGLVSLPLLGRLFGVHKDERVRTEVVLLITPRVLRNLPLPPASVLRRAGGTAADPGALPMRLSETARAAAPVATGGAAAPMPVPAAAASGAGLVLAAGAQVAPGGTVSVTLANPTELRIAGELEFDPAVFTNAAAGAEPGPRAAFDLAPGAELVLVLRAAGAAPVGTRSAVRAIVNSATTRDGGFQVLEPPPDAEIEVKP